MTASWNCRIGGMAAVGMLFCHAFGDTPFAVSVVEFAPAPGQFVNESYFNDPASVLGPPSGGGTYDSDSSSVVTLGGFGGYITLRFDHVVEDDPLNPLGLDAIIFGNAFWVDEEAHRHWAECTTIEIALDANRNGRIDERERWYLIPGSHITDPHAQYATRTWDDDPDTGIPPESLLWIPPGCGGTWTTGAYELPPDTFGPMVIQNPAANPGVEGIYGYAEYTPTLVLGDVDADNEVDDPLARPEDFYTVPDDPFTVGITPGSGGGDAFDIAWAVDPHTGYPARLEGFDFIRLTNPTDIVTPYFHEKSPEIDAVADVRPDPFGDCDEDGDIDLLDFACLQNCFDESGLPYEICGRVDREPDAIVALADHAPMVKRLTGPM